jgi:2'-5' RNA ligase
LVRTIGVAVGIPEPWGSQLDARRAGAGDPMAPYIPAHLTLLGPTEVDTSEETTGRIEMHLEAVAAAHRPFQLHLRGTGTFRPITEVVFVAVAAGISECERLADAIRSGPLNRELHFPYHPHVTVAHDVPADALDHVFDELAMFEARFPVAGFTLYEHGGDGHWQPLRHFYFADGHVSPILDALGGQDSPDHPRSAKTVQDPFRFGEPSGGVGRQRP